MNTLCPNGRGPSKNSKTPLFRVRIFEDPPWVPEAMGVSISHLPLLLRPISLLPNRCSRVLSHFSHPLAPWNVCPQNIFGQFSQNLTPISQIPHWGPPLFRVENFRDPPLTRKIKYGMLKTSLYTVYMNIKHIYFLPRHFVELHVEIFEDPPLFASKFRRSPNSCQNFRGPPILTGGGFHLNNECSLRS